MKTGMHVGNQVDMKESAEPLAKAIVSILNACGENRIDREVSLKALETLGAAAGVSHVTVQNCMIGDNAK